MLENIHKIRPPVEIPFGDVGDNLLQPDVGLSDISVVTADLSPVEKAEINSQLTGIVDNHIRPFVHQERARLREFRAEAAKTARVIGMVTIAALSAVEAIYLALPMNQAQNAQQVMEAWSYIPAIFVIGGIAGVGYYGISVWKEARKVNERIADLRQTVNDRLAQQVFANLVLDQQQQIVDMVRR